MISIILNRILLIVLSAVIFTNCVHKSDDLNSLARIYGLGEKDKLLLIDVDMCDTCFEEKRKQLNDHEISNTDIIVLSRSSKKAKLFMLNKNEVYIYDSLKIFDNSSFITGVFNFYEKKEKDLYKFIGN